jgi:hypothetical protein
MRLGSRQDDVVPLKVCEVDYDGDEHQDDRRA